MQGPKFIHNSIQGTKFSPKALIKGKKTSFDMCAPHGRDFSDSSSTHSWSDVVFGCSASRVPFIPKSFSSCPTTLSNAISIDQPNFFGPVRSPLTFPNNIDVSKKVRWGLIDKPHGFDRRVSSKSFRDLGVKVKQWVPK